jgi:hypothetical protein
VKTCLSNEGHPESEDRLSSQPVFFTFLIYLLFGLGGLLPLPLPEGLPIFVLGPLLGRGVPFAILHKF